MTLILATQHSGFWTVVGFGIVGLWVLGVAVYWTIQDIKDAPRRKRVKEANARIDAIRAARIARDIAAYELRKRSR